jgi:hypothetical protein
MKNTFSGSETKTAVNVARDISVASSNTNAETSLRESVADDGPDAVVMVRKFSVKSEIRPFSMETENARSLAMNSTDADLSFHFEIRRYASGVVMLAPSHLVSYLERLSEKIDSTLKSGRMDQSEADKSQTPQRNKKENAPDHFERISQPAEQGCDHYCY